MRILFCNYEYPPLGGGGAIVNRYLAKELAKEHEVTVLTSGGPDLPDDAVEDGVRVIRVPVFFRRQRFAANLPSLFAYMVMGTIAGKKHLKSHQYDVISTIFVLPTGPVGNALARFSGTPNVLTVIAGDIYDPSKFTSTHRHPILKAWAKKLIRRADKVIVNSKNVLGYMHRLYTPEIEGIQIPLGIERHPSTAASREAYGFAEDETLLVTVGRLVSRKALPKLIESMEAFRGEKVRLLIVGTGPQEQQLKEEIAARDLGAQVTLVGYVEDEEKRSILKMCDIYTSTSQHEGFGLVFVEGMAAGLPVVCYDQGGQTDYLEDQKTGYLVPLNDLDLFKERCRDLVKDKDKRYRMGQENLQRAEQLYIDSCAQRYLNVFESAVNNAQSSPVAGTAEMAR
ncbi:MAG: glycosyltransferase family 4 protein [Cyanobacteria bacterium P01_A01_bin.116]